MKGVPWIPQINKIFPDNCMLHTESKKMTEFLKRKVKLLFLFLKNRKFLIFFAAVFISVIILCGNLLQPGVNGIVLISSDNLLYPVQPLNVFIQPFQLFAHSAVLLHLPPYFSFVKILICLSPVLLMFASGAASFSAGAGILACFFSLFLILDSGFPFEQILITSAVLAPLYVFYSQFLSPAVRNILLAITVAVSIQAKGTCLPFAVIVLFFEFIRIKKNKQSLRPFLLVCLFVVACGLIWTVIATKESGKYCFFTEASDRLIPNLLSSVLGMEQTTEGNVKNVFFGEEIPSPLEIFGRTLEIFVADPLPFFYGIIRRIRMLAERCPVKLSLVLLWFFSIYQFRRNFMLLLLPVSAGYFFFMTIVMPLEMRYLFPAWFLMLLSGSVSLAFFVEDNDFPGDRIKIRHSAGICFAAGGGPIIIIWAVAMCLLIAFPFRYRKGNIDRYFNAHPDNIFLLRNPERKTYPDIWDFEARIKLLDRLNKVIPQYEYRWMRSWMEFYLSRKNASSRSVTLLPENYPSSDKIHWQELLLKSFDHFGAGNMEQGEKYLEKSLVSCLIAEAYVRSNKKYTTEEKEYAKKIAETMVPFCTWEYGKFFFSVPSWDKQLRKNLRSSAFAVNMLSEQEYLAFYRQKTGNECSRCCVPDKPLTFPSHCGNNSGKIYSTARADLIPVYIESSCTPLCFSGTVKDNPDFILRNCMQFYRLGDEKDAEMVEKYPSYGDNFYMRYRDLALSKALSLVNRERK